MIDNKLGSDVDTLVVGAGQAGLAAGMALRRAGLSFMIVDAADQPGGSWARYYDSLTLFSPSRFSSLPGLRLPGRRGRYPTRDEVTRYLRNYATHFQLPVRTSARVLDASWDGEAFEMTLADGARLAARSVIAASGGFGRPVIPDIPGATSYTGRLLHSAGYQNPDEYAGQRVVVVGAGNSAIQIAVELAGMANVTLATRVPSDSSGRHRWDRPPLLGPLERHREIAVRSAHPQPAQSTRRRTLRCRGRSRAARPAADVQTSDASRGHLARRNPRAHRLNSPGHRVPARCRLPCRYRCP